MAEADEALTPIEQRGKDILEEFAERQKLLEGAVLEEQEAKHVIHTRKQAGVSPDGLWARSSYRRDNH